MTSWTSPQLSYNTDYTVRVTVRDVPPPYAVPQSTPTVTSTSVAFRTGANPGSAPSAPTILSPADNWVLDSTGGYLSLPPETTSRPYFSATSTDADAGDTIVMQFNVCAGPAVPGTVSPPAGAKPLNPGTVCDASPWLASGTSWRPTSPLDFKVVHSWWVNVKNTADPSPFGVSSAIRTLFPLTPNIDDGVQLAVGWNPYVEVDTGKDETNGVNEGAGTFVYSATDANVMAVVPLSVNRTYNARNRKVGLFGKGWTSNLDAKIAYIPYNPTTGPTAVDPVVITLPDGRKEYYNWNQGSGKYVGAGNGFQNDLVKNFAGWTGWVYKYKDGSKLFFNQNGRLERSEDRNGNKQTIAYPSATQMVVQDAVSLRALTITLNANGRVSSVATPSVSAHGGPLTWAYTYDTADPTELKTVCPPTSAASASSPAVTGCWSYYSTGGRITSVVKPKGNAEVTVNYDTSWFTLLAPNLAANASFESAIGSTWAVSGADAGAGPSTVVVGGSTTGGVGSATSFKIPYGVTTATAQLLSEEIPVEPSTRYTISASVTGTAGGTAVPYWYGYDAAHVLVTSGVGGYGGDASWPLTPAWLGIRGTFRTPENVRFVKAGFQFPVSAVGARSVSVDTVMVEKGDGKLGRVSTRTDGAGAVTTFTYNFIGTTLEVNADDPRPSVPSRKDVYNDKFQLISSTTAPTAPTGEYPNGLTTTYTYDVNGFRNGMTDPAGRHTTIVSDDRGNMKQRTLDWFTPKRSEYWSYTTGTDLLSEYRNARSTSATDTTYLTTYTYDTAGNRTSEKDPAGNMRVWAYTGVNTDAAVGGTAGQFAPPGVVKSETDRSGKVIKYGYSRAGDQAKIDDPAKGVTLKSFDELGRVISVARDLSGTPTGAVTLQYDVRSRVWTITEPVIVNTAKTGSHQQKTVNLYNANDAILTATVSDLATTGADPARVTTTDYWPDDRVKTVKDAANNITQYFYDEVGNRTKVIDPRGVSITTNYDERNLATKVTMDNYFDVVGGATRALVQATFHYDNLGRKDSETDAIGRVTTFAYKPAGDDRVWKTTRKAYVNFDVNRTGTPGTRDVLMSTTEYDEIGNVISELHGTKLVKYTYDSRGFRTQSVRVIDGVDQVTSYATDAEGRPKTITTGSYVETTDYYPASKLLSSKTVSGVGASELYSYDVWGRLQTTTRPLGGVTTYTYDLADRVIQVVSPQVTVWDAAGATSASANPTVKFGYNTFGEKTQILSERSYLTEVTYDVLGRPTKSTFPSVTYTTGVVTPTEQVT